MDIITNCIEASLGKTSYSLLTNLTKGKSGISRWYYMDQKTKCLVLGSLDNLLQ